MKYGMTDDQYDLLDQLVIQPLKSHGAQVFIFGSRVQTGHQLHSDVDLLYESNSILPAGFISKLKETIEESRFPFAVDLVEMKSLAQSYRQRVLSERIQL
jgi:predicted nucleotidyltransferase